MEEQEHLQQIKEHLENEGVDTSALQETQEVESQEETAPVHNEIEQKALASGWNPEGEKSAEEWVKYEPIYKKLKHRGEEIKELKDTMHEMRSMMDRQRQQAYEQAYQDLQVQKYEAIESGDVDAVNVVDSQIESLRSQQVPQQPIPEVTQFMEKNKGWLQDTSVEAQNMRLMAEAKYIMLKNQGYSDREIVREVETTLQSTFPQRFETTNKPPVIESPSVEARASAARVAKEPTFKNLSSEQQKICRQFVKTGVMTEKEYITELKKLGEI